MLQIEVYRSTLQKYTLRGARDFFKLLRRVEKERSNERYLLEKLDGSDQDLVEVHTYTPFVLIKLLLNIYYIITKYALTGLYLCLLLIRRQLPITCHWVWG